SSDSGSPSWIARSSSGVAPAGTGIGRNTIAPPQGSGSTKSLAAGFGLLKRASQGGGVCARAAPAAIPAAIKNDAAQNFTAGPPKAPPARPSRQPRAPTPPRPRESAACRL